MRSRKSIALYRVPKTLAAPAWSCVWGWDYLPAASGGGNDRPGSNILLETAFVIAGVCGAARSGCTVRRNESAHTTCGNQVMSSIARNKAETPQDGRRN
jgi:hypothetical protein